MESGALPNVDTSKFLSRDAPKTIPTNPKWRCSDFALKMLEEGIHADITLRARGGSVKAHKSVLACISPVFNAMFQHDMREKLTSIVDIDDMNIDALQLFLLLLYTTKKVITRGMYSSSYQMPHFNDAIDKNFSEIHKAILKYQVENRLGSVLLSALARNLTPDNCWFYYGSSMRATTSFNNSTYEVCTNDYISENLHQVCNDYILMKFREVIESNSFLEEMRSNPGRIRGVIREALSWDGQNIPEALDRFLNYKGL